MITNSNSVEVRIDGKHIRNVLTWLLEQKHPELWATEEIKDEQYPDAWSVLTRTGEQMTEKATEQYFKNVESIVSSNQSVSFIFAVHFTDASMAEKFRTFLMIQKLQYK
jgi:predicted esterase YcpF (UPF0227 family)